MPKHYKEMMDEIINKMDEDAPVNKIMRKKKMFQIEEKLMPV